MQQDSNFAIIDGIVFSHRFALDVNNMKNAREMSAIDFDSVTGCNWFLGSAWEPMSARLCLACKMRFEAQPLDLRYQAGAW